MSRAAVLGFLLLFLSAPALRAEPPDGMDFGPRPTQPTPPAGGQPARPGKPEVVDPMEREIQDLATWPDRRGIGAAESLLLRGEQAVPRLVEVLSGEESPLQPGAAWVLGRSGEAAHVVAILRAAASRPNGSRAEVFFDAAFGLDAEKTKDWLFSFLTLRRPVFQAKATEFLSSHVGPEDQTRVLRLLDAPKPGVRVAGLRLLEPAGVKDGEERLIQALSDLGPEVARTASVLLALRATSQTLSRLNALARDGYARERAYAVLALMEVARTQATNPFEATTLVELGGRRGLIHPDKLSRTAAAVGLAFGALDSPDENLRALLDRTVIDVLVDAVGGDHFRDFPSFVEPVFAALRKLTGLDLPTTATAWAGWWQTERGRFQARRPLQGIAEGELPLAFVAYEAVEPNGRHHRAVFRSPDGAVERGDYVLEPDAFLALARAVQAAGIFDAAPVAKPRADEHIVVTLGVLNQSRRLVLGPEDERYPLLRMQLASLEEANLWQRYRDTDQWADAKAWWATNVQLMSQADPDARRAMLRAAIVQSFDDLQDDVERAQAIDVLEEMYDDELGTPAPGETVGLGAAEVSALADAATAGPTFGAVEERAVAFALKQPQARRAVPALVEALARRNEPQAAELLAGLLVEGGTALVREGYGDPRPVMRRAAARGSQLLLDQPAAREPERYETLDKALRPGLEVLSRDRDALVSLRALVALSRLGDAAVPARIEEIYKQGELGVKIESAKALGDLPADAAYPILSLMLAEERAQGSGALRAAALGALGRTNHPSAVKLLGFYLLNDADPGVQTAAADALVALDTDDARFTLVRALTDGQPIPARRARLVDTLGRFGGRTVEEVLSSYLEDPDPGVATAAALRLAEHNVGAAVPYLIGIVRSGDSVAAQAAVEALENLSTVRFEVTGFELIAEQYDGWYGASRPTMGPNPDRAWLRDGLRRRGYDVGPLTAYVAGETDTLGVPVLIRALRDDDPLLRRGAAIALERLTGLSLGEVTRRTSARDAARVADAWSRWWSRVGGASGAGR